MSFAAMREELKRRQEARCGVGSGASRASTSGFTLIELMIVIAIILILASIAVGNYRRSYDKAKEATLRQDLFVLRKAINDYTADKEAAPNSLDDLVSEHYIGKVPIDPITQNADWTVDSSNCDAVMSPDQMVGGICDVHSSSDATSPFDGTAYSSW
jgi:general secretion pathway protein G